MGFLKWDYILSSKILKPMVLGYPHFRNPHIYTVDTHDQNDVLMVSCEQILTLMFVHGFLASYRRIRWLTCRTTTAKMMILLQQVRCATSWKIWWCSWKSRMVIMSCKHMNFTYIAIELILVYRYMHIQNSGSIKASEQLSLIAQVKTQLLVFWNGLFGGPTWTNVFVNVKTTLKSELPQNFHLTPAPKSKVLGWCRRCYSSLPAGFASPSSQCRWVWWQMTCFKCGTYIIYTW